MQPCSDHPCDGCAWCMAGLCCQSMPGSPEHRPEQPTPAVKAVPTRPSRRTRLLADPELDLLMRHLIAIDEAGRQSRDPAVQAVYQVWREDVADRYHARLQALGFAVASSAWHRRQVWNAMAEELYARGAVKESEAPTMETSADLDRFTRDQRAALRVWLSEHEDGAPA
jgi:hypothetical protein